MAAIQLLLPLVSLHSPLDPIPGSSLVSFSMMCSKEFNDVILLQIHPPRFHWGSQGCWRPFLSSSTFSNPWKNQEQIGQNSFQTLFMVMAITSLHAVNIFMTPGRCYSPSKIITRLFLIHHLLTRLAKKVWPEYYFWKLQTLSIDWMKNVVFVADILHWHWDESHP